MKAYCIADERTVRGFCLAGVPGEIVTTPAQASAAVEKAIADPTCALVIVTEKLASAMKVELEQIRLSLDRPLVVEIPGPEGSIAADSLVRLVEAVVGMQAN